jgi:NADH-quinone oxidoreductase subunit E
MKKPVGQRDETETAKSADAPFTSAAGELPGWPSGLHPLMAHPTAAVAAATAIGLGVTSQMAGFMFGAMQGFVEAAQKAATQAGQEPQTAATPQRPADVAPAVEPVARPVAAKAKEQKRPRAARIVEAQADDLKRISGIGPKLEQVLNGMGIRQFAEIARWTEKDVKRVDDQLGFAGRIARDGWVEQAKALLKG